MIFLVTIMTINGIDFERREPMLDIASCWARAAERWEEIIRAHPEATGVGVGYALMAGDPV